MILKEENQLLEEFICFCIVRTEVVTLSRRKGAGMNELVVAFFWLLAPCRLPLGGALLAAGKPIPGGGAITGGPAGGSDE